MSSVIRPIRMSAAACYNSHSMVLSFIDECVPQVLGLEQMLPTYRQLAATLLSILNRRRRKVNTHRYTQADKKRDNGVGYIMMLVHAGLTSLLPAKR